MFEGFGAMSGSVLKFAKPNKPELEMGAAVNIETPVEPNLPIRNITIFKKNNTIIVDGKELLTAVETAKVVVYGSQGELLGVAALENLRNGY